MNTIESTIKEKNALGKIAFIPFIVFGDPNIEVSKEIILTLQESGSDIIEIGIPYSDPLADGPVIQKAAQRALKAGASLKKAISEIEEMKDKLKIPTIVFTYYNPILAYGVKKFIKDISKAGFKGVIVPDLPIEESKELITLSKENNIELILLVTPTSPEERIKKISELSSGFIYLTAVTGVTGTRENVSISVDDTLKKIQKYSDKPVCVGFGISQPEHVSKIKEIDAQGVIVGSAIIKIIQSDNNGSHDDIRKYVKSLTDNC